jgi:hypothetical protein
MNPEKEMSESLKEHFSKLRQLCMGNTLVIIKIRFENRAVPLPSI